MASILEAEARIALHIVKISINTSCAIARAQWCPFELVIPASEAVDPTTPTGSISIARRRSRAAAPGYSSGQAMAASKRCAHETLPQEMGYDWADLSYQENKAAGAAGYDLRASLLVVS